ncbi:PXMP2/4 family protein [Lachnellula suecica]|uniref:PXMP2/4 family protein n=1 Tax=Lachnellula suecica TaxID=602035 RepID=A0A8T9C8B2_9HELO|nr:PXMP2/4 family protein [Lachnellula suecica]
MSVKFEKDTIKQTGGVAGTQGIPSMRGGKHELADEIGTALTGGQGNVGTKGYLAAYLKQLQTNPLRTKMLTSGTLSGLQELLASWIAKDRNKNGNYFTARVPKMAAYGAFISAPLGHVLISILQKLFAGRTSLKAKILQILVSNLVIAPIQNSVYLVSMAIIAGAKTIHQVHATWKAGFMPVMKVSWISSPLALAFAQKFLPEHTWVPFFNIIAFFIGTYVNSVTKKKRLAALRKRYNDERGGRPDDYPSGPKY